MSKFYETPFMELEEIELEDVIMGSSEREGIDTEGDDFPVPTQPTQEP